MPSMYPTISDPQAYIEVADDFVNLNTAATNGLWASVNDGATGSLGLSTALGAGGWINIPCFRSASNRLNASNRF